MTTSMSRRFPVGLRVVMAAVLHLDPRHLVLVRANPTTLRFVVRVPIPGFRQGERLEAVLDAVDGSTNVSFVLDRAELDDAARATLTSFFEQLAAQIAREIDPGVGERNHRG